MICSAGPTNKNVIYFPDVSITLQILVIINLKFAISKNDFGGFRKTYSVGRADGRTDDGAQVHASLKFITMSEGSVRICATVMYSLAAVQWSKRVGLRF